ncbi:hypothetical protein EDD22DRAFT_865957 [Suillus occidentalis]|nr:hypothetical protein EDD22DRAFT_865957 [Suillus occidentalis]
MLGLTGALSVALSVTTQWSAEACFMGSPMHLADLTRTAHSMRCALSLLPAGESHGGNRPNSEKRSISANRSLMMMNTPWTAADASGPSSLTSGPGGNALRILKIEVS